MNYLVSCEDQGLEGLVVANDVEEAAKLMMEGTGEPGDEARPHRRRLPSFHACEIDPALVPAPEDA